MPIETALNTQIDEKLKEDFDIVCIRRKKKTKEGVAEALKVWMDGPPANLEAVDFGKLSDKEFAYLVATLQIIRERAPGFHQSIEGMLDAWLINHPVEKRHGSKRKSSGN